MSEQPVGADPITTTPDPVAAGDDGSTAVTPPAVTDPGTVTPAPTSPADITTPTVAVDPSSPAEPTPEQLQSEIDALTAKIAALQAAEQAAAATPAPPANIPPAASPAGTVPTTGAVQPAADPSVVTPAVPAPAPVDYGQVPDAVQAGSIIRFQPPPAPGADTSPVSYGIVLDRVTVDDTTGGAAQTGQDDSHTELVVAPLDAAGYRVTGSQLVDDTDPSES